MIDGEPIILGGDIILQVGDIRLSDPDAVKHIRLLMGTLLPGEELELTVLRSGRRVTLSAAAIPR